MKTQTRNLLMMLLALPLGGGAAFAAVTFDEPVSYTVGAGPRSTAIADVNQDGAPDVITADNGAGVSVLLGGPDGTLQDAVSFDAGRGPSAVAVADLDGDGLADVAAVNDHDEAVLLFGDGFGWFGAPQTYAVAKAPQWVAAADLDGDGDLDLVVVGRSEVVVLPGLGGGAFGDAVAYEAGNQMSSGALVDLDGDGALDLAAASATADAAVVLMGDGQGGFAAPSFFATGKDPKALLAVDLEGDGLLDLVTGNKGDATLSVLHGSGGGSFLAAVNYPVTGASSGLGWGDFDGDCVLDLAATNGQPDGRLEVLPGDGNGGFYAPQSFDTGASPKAMGVADLDGDLKMDLVIVQSAGSSVLVLHNNAPHPCTAFGIRRSTDPSAVRTSELHASATSAPFDDETGSLTDGQVYYYVVDSVAGTPLTLSVTANWTLDAVRLGFDDGDPASAVAEASLSTVSVYPATVPADGVSTSTVVVRPMDANGISLGAGLDVTVDEGLLAPAVLAGPVEDWGNGTYVFDVVSSASAPATVAITVEGTPLLTAPSLFFTTP